MFTLFPRRCSVKGSAPTHACKMLRSPVPQTHSTFLLREASPFGDMCPWARPWRTFSTSPAQGESLQSPPQETGTKVETSSQQRARHPDRLTFPAPRRRARSCGTGQAARGRTPGPHSSSPPTLPPLPGKSSLAFLPPTLLPGPPKGCPGRTGSATLLTVPSSCESHTCHGQVTNHVSATPSSAVSRVTKGSLCPELNIRRARPHWKQKGSEKGLQPCSGAPVFPRAPGCCWGAQGSTCLARAETASWLCAGRCGPPRQGAASAGDQAGLWEWSLGRSTGQKPGQQRPSHVGAVVPPLFHNAAPKPPRRAKFCYHKVNIL